MLHNVIDGHGLIEFHFYNQHRINLRGCRRLIKRYWLLISIYLLRLLEHVIMTWKHLLACLSTNEGDLTDVYLSKLIFANHSSHATQTSVCSMTFSIPFDFFQPRSSTFLRFSGSERFLRNLDLASCDRNNFKLVVLVIDCWHDDNFYWILWSSWHANLKKFLPS